ncbi:carboxypeptidase regulatory-like domain-containing protein [Allosphingosinicella flava]|uniref:Carboxypeptidase regulatory-like domain-containing protein n=1 Tax=Allosphingosinicella flava TaxID=2771430 RepID=A0A7T2GK42_9SPHN|nr:carboxypeptidase-like regulatory domain-containing protein [Sphingosinicella flava]QPQ55324.1 carboxypeptidase regulatory-like domain-containing protein [Sphingosinicella flava]
MLKSKKIAVLILMASSGAAQAYQSYTITGTVTAPRGVAVKGTQVIACSVPYQECKIEVSTEVDANGQFTLRLPGKGPYQVLASLDEDGDSNGEYLAVARDAAAINAPTSGLAIAMWKVGQQQRAAAATNTDVPALQGTWTHSATSNELVLGSTIKQIASSAVPVGYGTDLGGTFGAGSQTNSVIVTESKPVTVSRKMTLNVAADGTYRWNITKTMPDGGCTKTIKQEKIGRLLTDNGKITFATANGTESWSNTCGKGGSGKIGKSHETYDYSRSGNTLLVNGSGGVRWRFQKP